MNAARKRIERTVVAQLGQPVLRRPAAPVPLERIQSAGFQAFLDHMLQVLDDSGGVGLAAPQVFSGERVFLAAVLPFEDEEPEPVEIFINPVLSDLSPEKVSRWEGCLSFIELLVLVPRARRLKIDYLDRRGGAKCMVLSDFAARVVQHENDHLDGILTLDRALSTRDIIKASEFDDAVENDPDDEDDD